MDNSEDKKYIVIPTKERKKIRNKAIITFYKQGYSMDQICDLSKIHPELFYSTSGLSKTTVFFALHGRSKKSVKK